MRFFTRDCNTGFRDGFMLLQVFYNKGNFNRYYKGFMLLQHFARHF
ncbi:hypothetical protein APHMUC_0399 [Anaplasma phagocytophilum str. ApMUC09]|uniref:Uncharacterized protein n=1 Tax=Anaplasma phagocytophilum str. ApMUC09 TaxID=1359152 RepID=A0A0F3NA93_ANAPH|nr:hypothetical protein APHMUC_0399 [Anaplasma phagocytophilum str. ApMUC09]